MEDDLKSAAPEPEVKPLREAIETLLDLSGGVLRRMSDETLRELDDRIRGLFGSGFAALVNNVCDRCQNASLSADMFMEFMLLGAASHAPRD